jgi:hypothetical protein
MSELLDKCFSPASLNRLQLRNRVIRAATFEGMTAGGKPSDKLIDLHRSAAEGGVGMTTVAYCAVEADGRVMDEMMYMHEAIRPQLERPTSEVHATRNSLRLVGCDNCFDKQRIRGGAKGRKVSYFLILLYTILNLRIEQFRCICFLQALRVLLEGLPARGLTSFPVEKRSPINSPCGMVMSRDCVLNGDKTTRKLNYKPLVSVKIGLERMRNPVEKPAEISS